MALSPPSANPGPGPGSAPVQTGTAPVVPEYPLRIISVGAQVVAEIRQIPPDTLIERVILPLASDQ